MLDLSTDNSGSSSSDHSRSQTLSRTKRNGLLVMLTLTIMSSLLFWQARQSDAAWATVVRIVNFDFAVFEEDKNLRETVEIVKNKTAEQAYILAGKHPYQNDKKYLKSFIYHGSGVLIAQSYYTIRDHDKDCSIKAKEGDRCQDPLVDQERDDFLSLFANKYPGEKVRHPTPGELEIVFNSSSHKWGKNYGEWTNKVSLDDSDDYLTGMSGESSDFVLMFVDEDDEKDWLTSRAVVIIPGYEKKTTAAEAE